MPSDSASFLADLRAIYAAAQNSDDGERCAVAASPELLDRINTHLRTLALEAPGGGALMAKLSEPAAPGLNDGTIIPPDAFPLGTAPSVIRNAAAERAPLRGVLRVIVVLVDFSDRPMTATQNHFNDLFFSAGVIPTKSVREYYQDVTHGLIDIQGQVVGPFRMPRTLVEYAHGASGMGSAAPNAQNMARDAAVAANPSVNFAPYDNDGNGFVDAFIVVHAGPAAEVTGSPNDIWSHKWVLSGSALNADGTQIYGYLTVPEDARIGVCAHELGHLLFGFPDLYDTDYSSAGIGNWCLMAGGSWGGGGNTPVHPSAWCKANQGWANVNVIASNTAVSIQDVKTSPSVIRLWNGGAAGSEYFLLENRQQTGFDASMPGSGRLIWHIDETVSGNSSEAHPKVALIQADGQRDLELNHNRGDAGDPYPGSSNNTTFNYNSTPNSRSYAGTNTCVAVTGISPSGPAMHAELQVRCIIKNPKEFLKEKEFIWDSKPLRDKTLADTKLDKPVTDKLDKPITDKLDKPLDRPDGGRLTGDDGGTAAALARIEARLSTLEASIQQSRPPAALAAPEPFIGSNLRPDLSQGALTGEEDFAQLHQQMRMGSAQAKRNFDTGSGSR